MIPLIPNLSQLQLKLKEDIQEVTMSQFFLTKRLFLYQAYILPRYKIQVLLNIDDCNTTLS